MARKLISSLFFLFATGCLYSQDTVLPVQVSIKTQKEYSITRHKNHYRNEGLNITKDSVNEKRFDVEVTIQNTSSQSVFIWLMSTYWEENFLINNNYIFFAGRDVDHNFPTLVEIKPKQSKVYNTTLVKSIKFDFPCQNCIYGKQVETTRLGLIVISDIFKREYADYDLLMDDKSKWSIVWSNSLYLLTENEARPKPVQIPLYQNGQK